MGILHDALSALRATADKAIDFADPGKAISEAEDKFKAAVADAFGAIEKRIAALEDEAKNAAPQAVSDTSQAIAEVKDLLIDVLTRIQGVEAHPALSVPQLAPPAPPVPPLSTAAGDIAAAALAAAGNASA